MLTDLSLPTESRVRTGFSHFPGQAWMKLRFPPTPAHPHPPAPSSHAPPPPPTPPLGRRSAPRLFMGTPGGRTRDGDGTATPQLNRTLRQYSRGRGSWPWPSREPLLIKFGSQAAHVADMGPRRLYGDLLGKMRKSGKCKNSNLDFPSFSSNNSPKAPEESKTRCGDSRGTDKSPIRANLTDFLTFFKCFFQKVK